MLEQIEQILAKPEETWTNEDKKILEKGMKKYGREFIKQMRGKNTG